MPVISAFRRLRQDCPGFETSLGFIASDQPRGRVRPSLTIVIKARKFKCASGPLYKHFLNSQFLAKCDVCQASREAEVGDGWNLGIETSLNNIMRLGHNNINQ